MDKEPLLDSTEKDSKKTKVRNCIIGWIGMIIYVWAGAARIPILKLLDAPELLKMTWS